MLYCPAGSPAVIGVNSLERAVRQRFTIAHEIGHLQLHAFDGIHVDKPRDLKDLRGRLREGRILGAGGLETKHGAMEAGEAGIDYLMFGGLYPDGVAPEAETVRARAAWWAEIFETPCIAVATAADEIAPLAATGAEFVGLESGLWLPDPGAVERAQRAVRESEA